jgi:hypothetical protein
MICRDYELCKIPRKSIWTIDIYILYTMMITSFYIRFSSNQSVENLLLLRTSGLFWYSNSPARRVHQVSLDEVLSKQKNSLSSLALGPQ